MTPLVIAGDENDRRTVATLFTAILLIAKVARDRFEPPTREFSI